MSRTLVTVIIVAFAIAMTATPSVPLAAAADSPGKVLRHVVMY